MIRKILLYTAAAFFLLGAGTMAFGAEPRTDCVAQMSDLQDDVTVTDISPEEQSAVVTKKGPPPVTEPYTFSIASKNGTGYLIIHDGSCVLLPIGPAPLEQINNFLGRSQAQNG